MRERTILILAMLLAGCGRVVAPRGGIVSTNPCADQILVELVAPDRITAISHYSKETAASSLPVAVAARFPATSGTAEEVIALKPDLVVASSLTPLATREAYARAGLKVVTFDSPTSVAASEAQVMDLAQAVGSSGKGVSMVRRIEAALAAAAPPPGTRDPRTLLYLSGDLATGPGTLLDELMARTGLHNAARDHGLTHTGTLPLEAIIERPPDLILEPDGNARSARLRQHVLQYRTQQRIFPHSLANCGGPTIVAAAGALAAVRREITR